MLRSNTSQIAPNRSKTTLSTFAVVIGLAFGLSCGSGSGGGGCGSSGPELCVNCPPGNDVYFCDIPTTSNWVCAPDPATADAHCQAAGGPVTSKIECPSPSPDTGTPPPPANDEGDGADDAKPSPGEEPASAEKTPSRTPPADG